MPTARWKTKLGILFALVAVAGCNSPTLPLPPPAIPEEVTISGDGTRAELAGNGAQPGALVLVFNDEPTVMAGAIATADPQGHYRMSVPVDLSVHQQNRLEMWQRVGSDDSSLVSFLVRASATRGADAGTDAGADAGTDAGADVEPEPLEGGEGAAPDAAP